MRIRFLNKKRIGRLTFIAALSVCLVLAFSICCMCFAEEDACSVHDNSKTYDYREEDGKFIQRCTECGHDVRTIEVVVDKSDTVRNIDGDTYWTIDQINALKKTNVAGPFSSKTTDLLENVTNDLTMPFFVFVCGNTESIDRIPAEEGSYTAYLYVAYRNGEDWDLKYLKGLPYKFELGNNPCGWHRYCFETEEYGFYEFSCSLCRQTASIKLLLHDYDDTENQAFYYKEGMTWNDILDWETSNWSDTIYLTNKDRFSVEYSSQEITGPGRYSIIFRLWYPKDWDGINKYSDLSTIDIWIIDQDHNENDSYAYVKQGNNLVMQCKDCGLNVTSIEICPDQSLTQGVYEDGRIVWTVDEVQNCKANGIDPLTIKSTHLQAGSNVDASDNTKLVFTDKNGNYTFDFPRSAGDYTAYIAILNDALNPASAGVKSNGLNFRLASNCKSHDSSHEYEYRLSNNTIIQKCLDCGEDVRSFDINADKSKVNEYKSESTLTWSNEEIKKNYSKGSPFSVLETKYVNNTNETSKGNIRVIYMSKAKDASASFDFPKENGTYTAYVALLEKYDDPKSVVYKTNEINFVIRGTIDDEKSGYKTLTLNLLGKSRMNGGFFSYNLPGGKYILQDDLRITDGYISCMYGGTEIYLNGHTIYSTIAVMADTTIIDNPERKGGIVQSRGDWENESGYYDRSYVIKADRCKLTLTNISIYNSNSCALYVNRNANVTINNCSIRNSCAANRAGAVHIDSGSVTINDSVIQNCSGSNQAAIFVADGENTLTLKGATTIKENNYAISAGKGNKIYILDKTQVKNNKKAGLWVRKAGQDGLNLFLASTDDDIKVDVSIAEYNSWAADSYLLYINSNKTNKYLSKVFTRSDGGKVVGVTGSGNSYFYFGSGYSVNGNTIESKCASCNTEGAVTLVMPEFDNSEKQLYKEGTNLSTEIKIENSNWTDKHILAYPTVVYGYVNNANGRIESYKTVAPSKPGIYTVKLAILLVKNDISSEYVSTEEIKFTIGAAGECEHDNVEYFCEDNMITMRCTDCYTQLATAELYTLNGAPNTCVVENGRYVISECCGNELTVNYQDDEELFEELSVVYGYYQADGKIKYSLDAPKEPCKFVAHVAFLEDGNNPDSGLVQTDDVLFEYMYHDWKYEAGKLDLNAHCAICDEKASIHLESAGADYASRHLDTDAAEEHFDYEIFYQENWVGQKGIEQFYILYDGIAINDEFNSTYKNNVFYKPTISGNYTARIALLKDIKNPDTVYLSTEEMPYYLAGMPIGDPYLKIVDYSENQYKLLKAPQVVGSSYMVGSFEDLMWVARFGKDKNITITNDIVVNPITVINHGESIRCGSNIIYNWKGIGYYTGTFTGNIYGGGHTIYGLYSKGNDYAGLIVDGCNNYVDNLTIADSVLSANINAGGIVAVETTDTDGLNTALASFLNCRVLNCLIDQTSGSNTSLCAAGGIIGRYYEQGGLSKLTLGACVVDSRVSGEWAGGLIGIMQDNVSWWSARSKGNPYNVSTQMNYCINLGPVIGNSAAGGLIGETSSSGYECLCLDQCANLGEVRANYVDAGGLIARLNAIKDNSVITNCVNMGKVQGSSVGCGAFFGLVNRGKFKTSLDNRYSGCDKVVGRYYIQDTQYEFTAKALTSSDTVKTAVCHSLGNYVDWHWSWIECADCEGDGTLAKLCLACGEAHESKAIKSHGHNYVFGTCLYCLEEESKENSLASVFSEASGGIYIMIAVVCAMAAGVVLISKKKKTR